VSAFEAGWERFGPEAMRVPQARSLAEIAESHFRAEDLQERRENAEADEARAARVAAKESAFEDADFLGRAISHEQFIDEAVAYSDHLDQIEAHLRKREQARRVAAQQDRIAELEGQLEAQTVSATRSEARSLRTLTAANEAAAAFRRRAEGAGFRDDQDPGGYSRSRDADFGRGWPRGGPILGWSD
jgi:anion-transporting  ArsA/GET3 family ATPase